MDENIKSRLPSLYFIGGGVLFMWMGWFAKENPMPDDYALGFMGLVAVCFMSAYLFGRTRYTFDTIKGVLTIDRFLLIRVSHEERPLKSFGRIVIERERMISEKTNKEMYSYFHVKLKGSSRKKDVRVYVPKNRDTAREAAANLSSYLKIPFEEIEQTDEH